MLRMGAEMLQPLKRCKSDGTAYQRPAEIEALLGQALMMDPALLLARARVTNRTDPGFIQEEVLVHLIRRSLRLRDPLANSLLPRLGERCGRVLRRKVLETTVFDADEVREEIIFRLYELFAKDLRNPGDGILDFFEVRFNRAFVALRVDVIRKVTKHAPSVLLASLEDLAKQAEEDHDVSADLVDVAAEASLERGVLEADLFRHIQLLPMKERDVILRKYFDDLKTESTDQLEETVAKACGVSGSQVRAYLRSAYAYLKMRLEEKS